MTTATYKTQEKSEGNSLPSVAYKDRNVTFTCDEFQRIADNYCIGEIKSVPKLEKGGLVNYNFKVTTNKGTYMIRAKKGALSNWDRDRKNLEYAVTDHLNKSGFSYQTPQFLSNRAGEKLSRLEGKTYEVYERLPGKTQGKESLKESDIVKVVAEYHKAVQNLSVDKKDNSPREYDEGNWLQNKFQEIEEKVGLQGSGADKIMRENLPFIKESYQMLKKKARPNPTSVIAHNDLNVGNILYQNGEISGLIDFGNIKWGTKEQDLAKLTDGKPSEFGRVVEEYRTHNTLSDQEVDNILPERIFSELHAIRWAYEDLKKGDKISFLKGMVANLKKSRKYWDAQIQSKAS